MDHIDHPAEETHVVTNFLLRRDRGTDEILLVRRSQRVGSYRGSWAGVSGFVEPGVSPLEQAYTEICEETALTRDEVHLLRTGTTVRVDDDSLGRHWVVHPFLFEVSTPDRIQTDWEASEMQWVAPSSLAQIAIVPKLTDALATVYPLGDATPMSAPARLAPIRQSLDDALQTLRADREHGASWLARLVARSLRAAASAAPASNTTRARLLTMLQTAARDFASARLSMAAVANTAARVWAAAASAPTSRDALDHLRDEANRILEGEQSWAQTIHETLRPLLDGPLFTLSRSGTVERALIDLLPDLPDTAREIYVAESRPGGEGIATGRALAAAGWRVTLVADAAIGVYAARAVLALVGADSIRSDASVVNKIGAYPLALAAHDAGIPFYAACETLKIAAPSFPLILEEMDSAELLPDPIPGVAVRNPYFDQTPARLVNGIVTERGILSPADIARESACAEDALMSLQHPWTPA